MRSGFVMIRNPMQEAARSVAFLHDAVGRGLLFGSSSSFTVLLILPLFAVQSVDLVLLDGAGILRPREARA
jgi:hypothetical protein